MIEIWKLPKGDRKTVGRQIGNMEASVKRARMKVQILENSLNGAKWTLERNEKELIALYAKHNLTPQ